MGTVWVFLVRRTAGATITDRTRKALWVLSLELVTEFLDDPWEESVVEKVPVLEEVATFDLRSWMLTVEVV